MPSLSRQLAKWVVGLRYEDLPADVVDRAKGVTLQCVASVLIGSQNGAGKQAVKMVSEEETGVRKGATIMVDGTLVTKGGAAFANSEQALAGGKYDTFRMLTHPGTSIIPAALVGAEVAGASGKNYLTGVAAGYEVMERLAADFIPQVMSRGFHPGPVFSIFGAGVAAAKIMGLNEDQMNSAIALCASLASSNVEGRAAAARRCAKGRR
jgi:2-methylcitrate dehydratase PrpD